MASRHSLSCFQHLVVVVVMASLTLVTAVSAAASTIGFDPAFTNPAAPFTISECDAMCSSPGSVTLMLTLVRSGDLSTSATVLVATRAPSSSTNVLAATALLDYTPLSSVSVTFAPNERTKDVAVTIFSDGIYEEDESFEAVLENPSDGVMLATGATVAYINIQDGGDGEMNYCGLLVCMPVCE